MANSHRDKKNMINKPGNYVPDNTIAVYPINSADVSKIGNFINPLKNNNKREWFSKNFYRCLPLSIGNQQGFAVSLPFDFDVFWDGGDEKENLGFILHENEAEYRSESDATLVSHFGHGIFTIELPVIFRTPPNINLMTVAAPNFLNENIFPMTGVVESDNLRYPFTLNFRIMYPNVLTKVKANQPIASIIPIPRGYSEAFNIVDARQIFSEDIIKSEQYATQEHLNIRKRDEFDRTYYSGTDIFGNSFNNHRLPERKKV